MDRRRCQLWKVVKYDFLPKNMSPNSQTRCSGYSSPNILFLFCSNIVADLSRQVCSHLSNERDPSDGWRYDQWSLTKARQSARAMGKT